MRIFFIMEGTLVATMLLKYRLQGRTKVRLLRAVVFGRTRVRPYKR